MNSDGRKEGVWYMDLIKTTEFAIIMFPTHYKFFDRR